MISLLTLWMDGWKGGMKKCRGTVHPGKANVGPAGRSAATMTRRPSSVQDRAPVRPRFSSTLCLERLPLISLLIIHQRRTTLIILPDTRVA